MEFKDKLQELRRKSSVTQQELADAVFVSRSAIAKWENGHGIPSDVNFQSLCSFFALDEKDREEWQKCLNAYKLKRKIAFTSNLAIIIPIVFIVFSFVGIFHFHYEPDMVYPSIVMPAKSMFDVLKMWMIIPSLIWSFTMLFPVAVDTNTRLYRNRKLYFALQRALIIFSVITFIVVFIIANLSAMRMNYSFIGI